MVWSDAKVVCSGSAPAVVSKPNSSIVVFKKRWNPRIDSVRLNDRSFRSRPLYSQNTDPRAPMIPSVYLHSPPHLIPVKLTRSLGTLGSRDLNYGLQGCSGRRSHRSFGRGPAFSLNISPFRCRNGYRLRFRDRLVLRARFALPRPTRSMPKSHPT